MKALILIIILILSLSAETLRNGRTVHTDEEGKKYVGYDRNAECMDYENQILWVTRNDAYRKADGSLSVSCSDLHNIDMYYENSRRTNCVMYLDVLEFVEYTSGLYKAVCGSKKTPMRTSI